MPRKRKKYEREADLVVTATLYKKGWTMRQIAEQISRNRTYSISHVMIKHDLDLILSRWRQKQEQYIDNFVTLQLEQIQLMKKECWEEYMRSKSPTKKIKEKRDAIVNTGIHHIKKQEELMEFELDLMFNDDTKAPEPPEKTLADVEIQFTDLSEQVGVEVSQTVEMQERLGNPKYLDLIAKLMDQEARLLGFYNTDNLTPTTSVVVVKMPEPVDKTKFLPGAQKSDL